MHKKKSLKNKAIPDGWRMLKFGETFSFIEGGGTPSKKVPQYWDGEIPWATVKDISKFNPESTQEYITKTGLENSSSKLISSGTMVMPTRMLLGVSVFFNVDVAINQDLKAIYFKDDFDKKFMHYWVMCNSIQISQLGIGSTVAGITQDQLKAIKSYFPNLPEQKRIIAVLETWDSYLEKLERKIEIKKNIKKGLMQQLLTGKRRLKEFKDGWKVIRIQSMGQVVTGSTPPMKDEGNYGGQHCWATADDFTSKYIKDTRIKLSDSVKSLSRWLPKGSLLITCIASIGKNAIAAVPLATNQQINAVIVNDKYNNEFLFYLLSNSLSLLRRYAGAGAMLILNKNDFLNIELTVPLRNEQVAIADILTKVDEEIEALEHKKEIIKEQKNFLLINLITGKIRTPESIKV